MYALRQSFQMQVLLIEAHCERTIAIEYSLAEWPAGKVCEVTGTDIWTEVTVRVGPHRRMECAEILWPLFQDTIATCKFVQ